MLDRAPNAIDSVWERVTSYMNFNDLGVVRLLKLFRSNGFRHGMNAAVTSVTRRYFSNPGRVIPDLEGMLAEERIAYLSAPRSGPLKINWVVPGIGPAGGGLFNIFRAIQQLEAWGHVNVVYVLGKVPGDGSSAAAREYIRKWYFSINAHVVALPNTVKDSDALIATSWPTAYAVRGIGNTVQKFYFVQDLEHLFYAPGSFYEFARQTYQFEFRGITAGSWIADVLRRDFSMDCSVFNFSYDREVYAGTGRRLLTSRKKRVLFYSRPETERRGFELGVLALSLVAKRMPEVEFVMVGLPIDSFDVPFPAIFPGVLPVSELAALYRSCDVALVLSHTNLSLLPLELMACGCAVVSNEGPNIEWLLSDETVRLAKPDAKSLACAVIELLESDNLRLRKIEAGFAFVQGTDWTKEIRAIESALLAGVDCQVRLGSHV